MKMVVRKVSSVFLALLMALPTTVVAGDATAKTLFTNVNVFDGKNNKLTKNASVLIEGNKIKQVSAKKIAADGATVIDGGGRTRRSPNNLQLRHYWLI